MTNAAGGTAATVIVANSLIANNGSAGVLSLGNAATLRFGRRFLTGNGNAVQIQSSGTLTSYKNNEIDGNTNNNLPITGSPLN